jgi:hypothetical protein
VSTFGDISILRCRDCLYPYTSEDLAVATVVNHFSRDKIYSEGAKPTYKWEKGGKIPKA